MNEMIDDPWARLRGLTAARIGLPRSGASLATRPMLDLRLAHARARDAVAMALDIAALQADLTAAGHEVICVDSAALDRTDYKLRPDRGRVLAAGTALPQVAADLVVVVADGLSALAVQRHAVPFLTALYPALKGWALAPVVIARQGRVALGDAVALALGAGAVLVLLGERPGMSAPDSMGAYLTWRPAAGTTDAERNCVSNIRQDGLAPVDAARRVAWLLGEMRQRNTSGIGLKDATDGQRLIESDIKVNDLAYGSNKQTLPSGHPTRPERGSSTLATEGPKAAGHSQSPR